MIERVPRRWRVPALAATLVAAATGIAVTAFMRPPAPSAEAFCRELAGARDLDEGLAALDVTRIDPSLASLRRAEGVAPPEIRSSVTTVLAFVDGVVATVGTTSGDPRTALEAALRARQAEVPAVERAGAALDTYATDTCGLQLTLPSETAATEPPS